MADQGMPVVVCWEAVPSADLVVANPGIGMVVDFVGSYQPLAADLRPPVVLASDELLVQVALERAPFEQASFGLDRVVQVPIAVPAQTVVVGPLGKPEAPVEPAFEVEVVAVAEGVAVAVVEGVAVAVVEGVAVAALAVAVLDVAPGPV